MVQLREVTIITAPLERVFDLARSIEVHLRGNAHFEEQATEGARTGTWLDNRASPAAPLYAQPVTRTQRRHPASQ